MNTRIRSLSVAVLLMLGSLVTVNAASAAKIPDSKT